MKKKKEGLWLHVGANCVIVLVVAAVLVASLAGTDVIMMTASGKNKAIYKGNTAEPRVSLMVNVYWGTEYIEGMLDVLDAYGVKTTFFVGGSWAANNGEVLSAIHERGHEIGNHGYLHRDADKLTEKQNEEEIVVTERLVESLTGVKTTLFAPPSGAIGSAMFATCESLNYKVVMWSKDTIDWRDKDDSLVLKRATKGVQNGDLILMHPTAHTLKALPEILAYYKENGFQAVTVSQNLEPSVA